MGKTIKVDDAGAEIAIVGARQSVRSQIHPDVRALLDKVVVPILVREFLEILQSEKQLATPTNDVSAYDLEKFGSTLGKVTV